MVGLGQKQTFRCGNITVFADYDWLAINKSQEISNSSVAILIKQAVEIPLVDFLQELVGQLESINQFSKQFHFSSVF